MCDLCLDPRNCELQSLRVWAGKSSKSDESRKVQRAGRHKQRSDGRDMIPNRVTDEGSKVVREVEGVGDVVDGGVVMRETKTKRIYLCALPTQQG